MNRVGLKLAQLIGARYANVRGTFRFEMDHDNKLTKTPLLLHERGARLDKYFRLFVLRLPDQTTVRQASACRYRHLDHQEDRKNEDGQKLQVDPPIGSERWHVRWKASQRVDDDSGQKDQVIDDVTIFENFRGPLSTASDGDHNVDEKREHDQHQRER